MTTVKNISEQWLKFFKSLGIEFWLPLPILGISFWLGCGWLSQQTLMRSSHNPIELKTTQPDYGKNIALIKVEIYPEKNISLVTVKKLSRRYKLSKYKIILETTDIPSVEAAISNRVGLPREKLRKKLHYRWEK